MRKYGWIILTIAVSLAGCRSFYETVIPANTAAEPAAPQTAPQTPAAEIQPSADAVERRFSDAPISKMDAMQSITIWSQRYDELSQKTEKLRQDNTQMTLDTARLNQEIEQLKAQLQQCRQDVEQSNALLQEAHLELTKWKADVLGYRDEMRQAQAAQLSALTKILRILGAETAAPTDNAAAAQKETKP